VEVAKTLGGSSKLVTPAPKTVREMNDSTAQGNRKGWGYTNKLKQYKPRLNIKNTVGPTGLYHV